MTADRKTAGRVPNYFSKVLAKAQEANLPVGVTHAYVEHDEWCAFFRGGTCDCDPEIVLRAQDETH